MASTAASDHLPFGIWLFPDRPARELLAAARAAEAADLDEFWLGDEGPARDPFGLLAAAAVHTERIRLGVGVTNPYLRHPAISAVSALTVHELSGGRAVLGYGAGGGLSLGPLGLEVGRPATDIAAAIRIARAVEAGESVDAGDPVGSYHATPSAPNSEATPLPIVIGARGPVLNRLASQVADGVFLGGIPFSALPEVIALARSERPIDVALYVNTAVDADAAESQRVGLVYVYRNAPESTRARVGLRIEDLDVAIRSLEAGDSRPARELITDERRDDVVLHGPPGDVAERLAELVAGLGVTSIGLASQTPDPIGAVAHAAETARHFRKQV